MGAVIFEEVLLIGVLETDDGSVQKMQIAVSRSKVPVVLYYPHGGFSGGKLEVTKNIESARAILFK